MRFSRVHDLGSLRAGTTCQVLVGAHAWTQAEAAAFKARGGACAWAEGLGGLGQRVQAATSEGVCSPPLSF